MPKVSVQLTVTMRNWPRHQAPKLREKDDVAGFLHESYQRAYNAAHAAALAALRWHGYRSENRYTVFQSLTHTLGWPANRWRVLDAAHQKRNLAEYEGYLDVEESTVTEMCELVQSLIVDVKTLVNR